MIAVFAISVIISSYRLVRGPTIADRVIAIDVVTYSLVVIIGIVAVVISSPYLIVISFSLALWFFVGVLYIARYLEGDSIGD